VEPRLRTSVPAATFARRQSRLEELCRASNVGGLLLYGNEAARHDIRYASGWGPGWDTFMLVVPGRRPALWIPSENHVPTARAVASETVDVDWAGPDPAGTVAQALTAGGRLSPPRLGVVGPLPHRTWLALEERVPGIELVDLGPAFLRLRLVKDAAEITLARRAAALGDVAVEELVAALRPGLRDFELGAIVEAAYRRRGGEHGICFLASSPMAGGGALVPALVWSDRVVGQGDIVTLELSVGVEGVTSQVLRTIALGPPAPAVRRLHEVADEAFAALLAAATPGAPAGRLLEVAGLIDRAGFTVVDDVVHGYGGGYLPPILRTPATQRRPPPDLVLEPGMFLVIQPNVVDATAGLGVQTGELVVVTDRGAERLHGLPTGLLQAR
jgi:Xaa-Pro aminopeptidase